jgi:ADP-ribosylglycohydrolase
LNLARGLKPPATATYRNPYREWIGAQIRADAFGYLTPGNPKLAASLAFKDASLSHTKNGIYGEMFIAAVISASLATNKLQEAINMGLAQVPSKSRLHELVEKVLNWKARALTWQEAWEKMNEAYGKYHWVHTLPNLAIVLIALLWGENNIRRTVSIAVMGGWDTDCNGATAGSIMGALNGKNAIPSDLTDLFNDRIKSAVFGHSDEKLGNYVQQTISIINSTKSS